MSAVKKNKTIYVSDSLELREITPNTIPESVDTKQSNLKAIQIPREQYTMLLYSYIYPQLKAIKNNNQASCMICGKTTDEKERILCFDCFKANKEKIYEQIISGPTEIII